MPPRIHRSKLSIALVVIAPLILMSTNAHAAGRSAKEAKEAKAPAQQATEAKFDKLGPLMSQIGLEAARIVGGDPDGLFLYAEMNKGRASVIVLKDRGKTAKWYMESLKLQGLIEQAWQLEAQELRWVAMAYVVDGRTFDTHLIYPEEFDRNLPFEQRLFSHMPSRFGGKRLVIDPLVKENFAAMEKLAGD